MSWNFVISHGILLIILPSISPNLCIFPPDIRILRIGVESIIQPFLRNVVNAKSEQRKKESHGRLKNFHGNVLGKMLTQSVGAL